MQIDFYEEFPSRKTLVKLKLIKFPTRIFVAAKSLEEYEKFKKIAKGYNSDVKVAYWPIVKNSYWISPFSNTQDLVELFDELDSTSGGLLIDLELPMKNKVLFLKNFFCVFRNRKLIKNFLEKNKKRITMAEFPSSLFSFFYKIVGIDYSIGLEKSLMWYSSMCSEFVNRHIRKHLKKLKDKDKYSISLGTIDFGIFGNEPKLSFEKMERDLDFVKSVGFRNVVIFRLGGLDKDYVCVLEKFV